MSEALDFLKSKYRCIAQSLTSEYGHPEWRPHLPPVDELVSTILSQNTNDVNRDKAFDALKVRFPDWESVRDAEMQEVIDVIRVAGLSNQKGPRIQAALRHLTETQGHITLDHLREMPVKDAKAWLTNIDGVGPKTAAIILLFAMNKPAFPVDTHVYRVAKRLGLINPSTNREQAHEKLEEIVPPKDYYSFHLHMIQHGRAICHARGPKCAICVLQSECDYYSGKPKQ